MRDVVLDTDVASLLQKERAPAWVDRHIAGRRVWLTFVGVLTVDERNRAGLDAWVDHRPVIPYTTRSRGAGSASPPAPTAGAARGRRTTLG